MAIAFSGPTCYSRAETKGESDFAAGCSREVISNGAQMLGWEPDTLLARTLLAMQSCEAEVLARTAQLTEGARE